MSTEQRQSAPKTLAALTIEKRISAYDMCYAGTEHEDNVHRELRAIIEAESL